VQKLKVNNDKIKGDVYWGDASGPIYTTILFFYLKAVDFANDMLQALKIGMLYLK